MWWLPQANGQRCTYQGNNETGRCEIVCLSTTTTQTEEVNDGGWLHGWTTEHAMRYAVFGATSTILLTSLSDMYIMHAHALKLSIHPMAVGTNESRGPFQHLRLHLIMCIGICQEKFALPYST